MKKKLIAGLIIIFVFAIFLIPQYQKNQKISTCAIDLAKESLLEDGYENLTIKVVNIAKREYIDMYDVKLKIIIDENEYDPFLVARSPISKMDTIEDMMVVIAEVNVYNQENNLLYSNERLNNQNTDENEADDFGMCWSLAKETVKSNLKAPSTAEFPFSYNSEGVSITCDNNTYTVNAWVDAENSFGAQIRSKFTVVIEKNGTGKNATFTVISCVIE